MNRATTQLTIDWSEAIGPVMHAPLPYLFGWLRSFHTQSGRIAYGRVVVVARSVPSMTWTHYEGHVCEADAVALASALADLGLATTPPRVESVLDSSDTWYSSNVRIALGDDEQAFAVHAQCSGFHGAEADGLRAVFQRILELSGYGARPSIFQASL
jgi:hypothetical protein